MKWLLGAGVAFLALLGFLDIRAEILKELDQTYTYGREDQALADKVTIEAVLNDRQQLLDALHNLQSDYQRMNAQQNPRI